MFILKVTLNAIREKQGEMLQTMVAIFNVMNTDKACGKYNVFRNINEESSFIALSEWKTREQLVKYLDSDKFSVLLGMKNLLKKPIQIQIHTVTKSEGMSMVRAVKKEASL